MECLIHVIYHFFNCLIKVCDITNYTLMSLYLYVNVFCKTLQKVKSICCYGFSNNHLIGMCRDSLMFRLIVSSFYYY